MTTNDVIQFAETGYTKLSNFAVATVILSVLGVLPPSGPITLFLLTSAATLGVLGIFIFSLSHRCCRMRSVALNAISEFI